MRTLLGNSIAGISAALTAVAMAGPGSVADIPDHDPGSFVPLKMLLQLSGPPKSEFALSDKNNLGFEDCRRVGENELNDMRGGFQINVGGLPGLLSIGVEKMTFVNGELVAKTTFNLLPQLNASEMREVIVNQMVLPSAAGIKSTITPAAAPTATAAPIAAAPASSTLVAQTQNYQPIQVIQIGPGNTFTLPNNMTNLNSGMMAVIQNTLDNQVIRNMTIINATLATQEMIRSMAINSALSRIAPNFGR
jgi:hypothetical protein